jgi:hypothetical protein
MGAGSRAVLQAAMESVGSMVETARELFGIGRNSRKIVTIIAFSLRIDSIA